jgi:hypothetical protein
MASEDIALDPSGYIASASLPKASKWRCEMYGLGPTGVILRPMVGNEPTWFHRAMQRVLLGHKWIKETE